MTSQHEENPPAPADDRRHAPSGALRIIVVGAGGFGREVVEWMSNAWPDQSRKVAGFLAEDEKDVQTALGRLPILGNPRTFVVESGDRFVMGIGIPGTRRRIAECLEMRGATFLTLIHPTAIVAKTAVIGEGSIVCPFAVLSDGSRLGRYVLVNYYASLGHDAQVGNFCVLSPYATVGGHAVADEEVFLGMHATVGPRRSVGRGSKVSAGSCALYDVGPNSLVFGVPGKTLPRIDLSLE